MCIVWGGGKARHHGRQANVSKGKSWNLAVVYVATLNHTQPQEEMGELTSFSLRTWITILKQEIIAMHIIALLMTLEVLLFTVFF